MELCRTCTHDFTMKVNIVYTNQQNVMYLTLSDPYFNALQNIFFFTFSILIPSKKNLHMHNTNIHYVGIYLYIELYTQNNKQNASYLIPHSINQCRSVCVFFMPTSSVRANVQYTTKLKSYVRQRWWWWYESNTPNKMFYKKFLMKIDRANV